jgi:hypothetical protein
MANTKQIVKDVIKDYKKIDKLIVAMTKHNVDNAKEVEETNSQLMDKIAQLGILANGELEGMKKL